MSKSKFDLTDLIVYLTFFGIIIFVVTTAVILAAWYGEVIHHHLHILILNSEIATGFSFFVVVIITMISLMGAAMKGNQT